MDDEADRPRGPSEADDKPVPNSSLPRMVAPGTPIPAARCALVPEGGVFEGQVALVGETRIEGVIRGRVRGEGRLLLGPRGRIEGVLECDEVDCEGVVQGPIHARRSLRLGPDARLEGDVETPKMEVCPTAVWNGTARVGSWRIGQASPPATRQRDAPDGSPSG
jgi:cytoskeletal protein CcmA (bactofilin family)